MPPNYYDHIQHTNTGQGSSLNIEQPLSLKAGCYLFSTKSTVKCMILRDPSLYSKYIEIEKDGIAIVSFLLQKKIFPFLRFIKSVSPSVRPSVRPSVSQSVSQSVS